MNRKMTMEQLSTVDDDGFLVALEGLYAHSEWVVRRVARARPFASPAALLHALWRSVADASEDEQLAVIRAHPDLTDSAATRETFGGGCHLGTLATSPAERDSAAPSKPEDDDAGLLDSLREKVIAENLAYRKRFGFPFILAADHLDRSGASVVAAVGAAAAMADILAALQRRLRAQRRDELAEAVRQVNRIAELRFNHLLGRQVFHGREVMRWCEALAVHSDDAAVDAAGRVPAVLTCTYLTPAHHACADLIAEWMRRAGMQAHIDIFGNVIGRYRSSVVGARSVVTGSHYDTVRNGGKYDGRVGILLPITLIAEMHRRGERFPFDIDVIAFAEEEGVRFKTSFLGSSVLTGNIDASVLARTDEQGVPLREAVLANAQRLAARDGAAQDLPSAPDKPSLPHDDENVLQQALRDGKRDPSTVLAFLEVHIEQGPVLFTEQVPVGVVTAISGSKRYLVHLTGIAGHAGAMPMDLRRDAAAAAAEITLYVEQRCSGVPSLVGTVGRLEVPNGSVNVVPGRCLLSLDIRAGEDGIRDAAVSDVMTRIQAICARRGIQVETELVLASDTVPCAPALQARFVRALDRLGVPIRHLPSGAGHDAVEMSRIADVAMLFVRCGNGGISHNPLETVTAEDLDLAAQAFRDTLDGLAADEWRRVAELDRMRT
ncbi:hydantoinase/carbamoylase family amidase [Robbsia sp. KACC 23696]|uniref:hydantoinase/carbamoylase family amidase n=1 Tax=Robbsia sp. KACC 23696 TaxID=3149231 RepID=UPI00325A4C0C